MSIKKEPSDQGVKKLYSSNWFEGSARRGLLQ
jgi:hypothetical protein